MSVELTRLRLKHILGVEDSVIRFRFCPPPAELLKFLIPLLDLKEPLSKEQCVDAVRNAYTLFLDHGSWHLRIPGRPSAPFVSLSFFPEFVGDALDAATEDQRDLYLHALTLPLEPSACLTQFLNFTRTLGAFVARLGKSWPSEELAAKFMSLGGFLLFADLINIALGSKEYNSQVIPRLILSRSPTFRDELVLYHLENLDMRIMFLKPEASDGGMSYQELLATSKITPPTHKESWISWAELISPSDPNACYGMVPMMEGGGLTSKNLLNLDDHGSVFRPFFFPEDLRESPIFNVLEP